MKKIAILCSAVLLAACSTPANQTMQKTCLPLNLAGGYQVQNQITPEAEQALSTVLAQMNTAAKLEKIIEVRTQVVAGTNYAITFQLNNGEIWHTVVWRDLQGNYKMTQPASKTPFTPMCAS